MIPVNIEDMIKNLIDNKKPIHYRQYYYDSLVKINQASKLAIEMYEKELNERSR